MPAGHRLVVKPRLDVDDHVCDQRPPVGGRERQTLVGELELDPRAELATVTAGALRPDRRDLVDGPRSRNDDPPKRASLRGERCPRRHASRG